MTIFDSSPRSGMTSIKHFLESILYIICGVLLLYLVLAACGLFAAVVVPILCVQDAIKIFNDKQKGKK